MGENVRRQYDQERTLPSSPTGRVPQWVLDEATGRAAPPEPWRSWAPTEPRRARRRRNWTGVGGAVLVVAIVVLGAAGTRFGLFADPAAIAGVSAAPDMPTPGADSSDDPLGTPLSPPAAGGSYDFLQQQDDGVTPVGYDPCRPVHYVVRPDNAPVGGEALIESAVARVSEVTGLQFVYDGATDEDLVDQRAPFQPDRYGDRWAPVLITWETVAEQPDFAADVAGLGGSLGTSAGDGPAVFVTGTVQLDAAEFADLATWPNGAAVARAIVLHELGHVVGLDHVDDPSQLMYPTTSAVLDFAPGDLTGLAQLGAGACEPRL
ncbi:Peptidase metallopeptidase [Modestobacter italicus]|uniref:Peptidase metallopeptidase n=1 Tax=Modestobacter italicus (strain DSM 44449 / CECT 9708 / BC 501) TaxID=2732864 RepID=I4F1I0_MODI5|nr:matrixin family metalloprotease [Modestobacter marinus]CCH89493.1 Peptidase metallopeptidase [Modestobacter marinus]